MTEWPTTPIAGEADDGSSIRALPELVIYVRDGCHLCQDMQQQLYELLPPQSFHLTRVDIDEQESLRAAYHVRVPVLGLRQGSVLTVLCEHFLDLQAVTEALAGYNA